MERDFLGAIGRAGKAGDPVKNETWTEQDTPPPATQWQFPAKSSAAPAFMSFRTAKAEEGAREFSISGFRPPAANGDAFDGIKKQASLPVMPQQRQFGLNSQMTAQQYPAAPRVPGMDYGAAAHHHLPGGSRMVQPVSVRHPTPFNQANSMMLRSQSFHSGTGMPFKNQQPFTMSNGFGGSTVGVYGSRNPRSQTSTQLTIFYNGSVNVFDNVPVEKAKEIMMLASRASIPSPQSASHKPGSPISAPAKVNVPEVLPARQLVVQKTEPSVPHLSSTSSPISIVPQVVTLSRSTSNTTESTGPKPVVQIPVTAPTSQASSSQPMPLATTSAAAAAAAAVPRAVPQARKASLARFLEKRKERVTTVEPYPTSKSPLQSSDIGSPSAPTKSSSTDFAPTSSNGKEPLHFGQPRNISFSSEACPSTKLQI